MFELFLVLYALPRYTGRSCIQTLNAQCNTDTQDCAMGWRLSHVVHSEFRNLWRRGWRHLAGCHRATWPVIYLTDSLKRNRELAMQQTDTLGDRLPTGLKEFGEGGRGKGEGASGCIGVLMWLRQSRFLISKHIYENSSEATLPCSGPLLADPGEGMTISVHKSITRSKFHYLYECFIVQKDSYV